MKWLPRIRSESGMTLIELMIAVAVSGIVMAGVVQIFVSSSSSHSLQTEMATMQQNVRMAKMFLERDVRMAGCGIEEYYDLGTRVYPVDFTNAGGESDTDILVINYMYPDNDPCLPQLTLRYKMPVASAEATVNEDLEITPYSAWDNAFVCAGTTYGGTPFKEFKAIITAPDGSKSDVVYITQVQGNSSKLQNRPYDGFSNKIINSYPENSTIGFLSDTSFLQITYSYTYSNGNGTLLRNGEAVADNIEDLQFAFGLDTNTDDIVDSWINDRDLTSVEKDQIRLVRINILGCTSREFRGQSNPRPTVEDHHAETSPDNFGRQLFQVTVTPRNLK
jgi:prepilin-type N-terminal cleavage/methylation domain-containing protein